MKGIKIVERKNKKLSDNQKKLLIAAGLVFLLNTTVHIGTFMTDKAREKYISDNYNIAEVSNVDDNFTQILWLNYTYCINNNDEKICLVIDECLNNLTKENIARVNSLLELEEQYENTIFSDIVQIENYDSYYVDYTDLAKRKVAEGKQLNIDHSKSVKVGGKTYIEIDELLSILYDNYKGELRSITF